ENAERLGALISTAPTGGWPSWASWHFGVDRRSSEVSLRMHHRVPGPGDAGEPQSRSGPRHRTWQHFERQCPTESPSRAVRSTDAQYLLTENGRRRYSATDRRAASAGACALTPFIAGWSDELSQWDSRRNGEFEVSQGRDETQ